MSREKEQEYSFEPSIYGNSPVRFDGDRCSRCFLGHHHTLSEHYENQRKYDFYRKRIEESPATIEAWYAANVPGTPRPR